jgi:large subunit ribosomal protein L17
MDSSARKAMWRNMVTSLMLHGRIRTTEHRAKELRGFADRVITIGKRAPTPDAIEGLEGDALQRARAARVTAIRRARNWINNDEALDRVFSEYAERFRTRAGGYTRVVKAGRRGGDNASMAIIELVESMEDAAASAAAADSEDAPISTAPEVAAPIVEADDEPTLMDDQVVADDAAVDEEQEPDTLMEDQTDADAAPVNEEDEADILMEDVDGPEE